MSYEQLVEKSSAFVRRFPIEDWVWLWILESMTEWVWPPQLEPLPEYRRDYDVLQRVRNAVRVASRRENSGRILVFDSLTENRFLTLDEARNVDPKIALQTFNRLEAFLNIYKLEWRLSVSIVPFGELIDELESIIARFKEGENNTALLEPMSLLWRRAGRRWIQGVASGVLALFSLGMLIPFEQISHFLPILAAFGLVTLIGLLFFCTMETWESFPALLPSEPD